MNDVFSKYAPPSPVTLPSPFQWGDEEAVRSLFDAAASVELERRFLDWEFESLEAMRFVLESHGGSVMAKRTQPPEVIESAGRELESLILELNEGTQKRILIRNEYLLVLAHKI
jgi:hypothetical protein